MNEGDLVKVDKRHWCRGSEKGIVVEFSLNLKAKNKVKVRFEQQGVGLEGGFELWFAEEDLTFVD